MKGSESTDDTQSTVLQKTVEIAKSEVPRDTGAVGPADPTSSTEFRDISPITTQPEKLDECSVLPPRNGALAFHDDDEAQEAANILEPAFLCPVISRRYAWMREELVETLSIDFNESKSTGGAPVFHQQRYLYAVDTNASPKSSMLIQNSNGHALASQEKRYPNPPLTRIPEQECTPNTEVPEKNTSRHANGGDFRKPPSEPTKYVVAVPNCPGHYHSQPPLVSVPTDPQPLQGFPRPGGCPHPMSVYTPAHCRLPAPHIHTMVVGPALPDYDRARRLELQEQAKNAGICALCTMIFCCCCLDVSKDFLPRYDKSANDQSEETDNGKMKSK